MLQNILFDLDGTLTNPEKGITTGVQIALRRFGIEENDPDRLRAFIGPPLWAMFRQQYGLSAEEAERAVGYYREYYVDTGLFENFVYPGIPELLDRLRQDGRRLWVATSKPTVMAERVLRHFGLDASFERICGIGLNDADKSKSDVIADVLTDFELTPAETVMAGDRKYDIEGGRANGLRTVGVTWGFGSVAELLLAGATALAQDPASLPEILAWWEAHPNGEPFQPPAGFPPFMG